MQQMQFAIILAFISICQVLIVTPDPMPAPTVDSINAKSFVVQFKPVVGATKYYVTVAPRHVGTIPAPLETSGLTVTVQNLTEFKIYYVSVQDGNGQVGNTAEIRTLPRVSNIHLGAPLPHAVDVFFNMKYSAAITGWRMQYEKTNSENVTPMEVDANTTYSFRVTDLAPDTPYRIRARPLQLYGTTQILESEELYSSWTSFTTDSLSIFGRVVLTNVTYTANHKTPYGPEWNSSQEIIEQGYSSINNNGISLIRIEESDGGKAQIHYRVKVKDKSLPSPTDFSLNGTDFTDSFINNGDVALGKTYIYKAGDAWTLIYSPDEGSTCDKLVERYMIVTPQDDATFEIHLNVASSDATTAYEDDALRVKSDGRLVTDDAETARTVSLNTVLVLSPRFLIKDCLTKVATPLYTEYFEATNADTSVPFTNTYESTGTIASIFNRTAVTHTFCIDGTCVTLSIPAVAKAIKYEVFTSESIDAVSTLEERDIDGSDFLKVLVDSLVNGTTYIFTLKITTRGLDDRTSSFMTNSFNVTPTASPPVTASSSTSMTTLRTTPTTPIRTSRTTTTSASGKQQNSRSYSRGWSSCVGAYPAHCSRCYSSWSNRCCRHLPCCTHLKALCCLNQENRGNNVYYRPCNYFSFCVNSHYQAKESQPERKSRYQERGSTRYSHHGRKLQTRYSLYKHSSPSFAETFYSTKTPTYTYSQSERRSRYQARGSPTYHHPRIYDTRDRYSLYKPSSSSTMQINYQMKSPRYTHTYSRYVRQPTYGNRHGYANQQYVHHTRSHYLLYRKNSSPLGIS